MSSVNLRLSSVIPGTPAARAQPRPSKRLKRDGLRRGGPWLAASAVVCPAISLMSSFIVSGGFTPNLRNNCHPTWITADDAANAFDVHFAGFKTLPTE